MGADIHIFAETKNKKGKWIKVEKECFSLSKWEVEEFGKKKTESPFDWRSYSMFGFLADVRNYSCCEPISEPKGLPTDSEYLNELGYYSGTGWGMSNSTKREDIYSDGSSHSHSYLTLKELLEFDYDKTFCDERAETDTHKTIITHRQHLDGMFFTHLEELKKLGKPDEVRIVFYFDN